LKEKKKKKKTNGDICCTCKPHIRTLLPNQSEIKWRITQGQHNSQCCPNLKTFVEAAKSEGRERFEEKKKAKKKKRVKA
jgi:hypothetical protein